MKTPRTDAQVNGKPCIRFAIMAGDSLKNAPVASEFARELENEITEMKAQLKQLIEQWTECLGFLPIGEKIGYQDCINELQMILDGNQSPIEKL